MSSREGSLSVCMHQSGGGGARQLWLTLQVLCQPHWWYVGPGNLPWIYHFITFVHELQLFYPINTSINSCTFNLICMLQAALLSVQQEYSVLDKHLLGEVVMYVRQWSKRLILRRDELFSPIFNNQATVYCPFLFHQWSQWKSSRLVHGKEVLSRPSVPRMKRRLGAAAWQIDSVVVHH